MDFNKNNLGLANSPYLLQHKDNPVWWQTWSEDVLQYAQKNNKPLLISIGYSACHWCHVMEHESFEKEEVASIMNKFFINIKIDREERPDLDIIYMNALHLMNNQGGWPLNIVALPNGQPFFGSTYFNKDKWMHILTQIGEQYYTNFNVIKEYARKLSEGINQLEIISFNSNSELKKEWLDTQLLYIAQTFDRNWGGFSKAPKFPLPVLWTFLLRYGVQTHNEEIKNQVKLTLDRMSWGGIYDQIGGGFSRYSVDAYWKIPHFEKMLYDNAQLLFLYAQGYKYFKDEKYAQVIKETICWIEQELLSKEKGFYSSLDADSEGVEGKYYVWNTNELKRILGREYEIFSQFYSVEEFGYWEDNNSVLIQLETINEVARKLKIDENKLTNSLKNSKRKLKIEREKRISPNLDDKIITSWNALIISGLLASHQALQKDKYLNLAENGFQFIKDKLYREGILYRNYRNGSAAIPAFLDDYAFTLQASLDLYETTFTKSYLDFAIDLMKNINFNFLNRKTQLYSFRSLNEPLFIAETYPIHDSVEPSGNSVMAINLFKLGKIISNDTYLTHSKQMLQNVLPKINKHPSGFSSWLQLYMNFVYDFNEIVILGKEYVIKKNEIQTHYIPNSIIIGSEKEEFLELMKYRYVENKTLLYLCKNNSCLLPEKETYKFLEKYI